MKTPAIKLASSNAKSAIIDILNGRLADAIDLALITKQAHWNLKGPKGFSCLMCYLLSIAMRCASAPL